MTGTIKQLEKDLTKAESKPEQLAKILYGAIVRYVKAQNARIGEKNAKFELDSDRKWRANVHGKDIA